VLSDGGRMKWQFTVVLVLVLSGATVSGQGATTNWIGRWTSTVTPGRGEAPAITAAFTVENRDGKLLVTLQEDREPYPASVFVRSKSESLLVVKPPSTARGTRMYIIRPTGLDRVQLELFFEYANARQGDSFYYSEVFARVRKE
jgi:hypothetical protein